MRPPKSTAKHIQDGTFRSDRHGKRLDTVTCGESLGDCPDRFNDEQKKLWGMVSRNFPIGVLREVDSVLLGGMCQWYKMFLDIVQCLEMLTPSDSEYFKLNQMATIAWKNVSTEATKFAMSPSDRAKIIQNANDSTEASKPLSRLGLYNAENA